VTGIAVCCIVNFFKCKVLVFRNSKVDHHNFHYTQFMGGGFLVGGRVEEVAEWLT